MAKNEKKQLDEEQKTYDDIGGADSATKAKEVDLFEEIPSFVVDKNWKIGRTLAGKFMKTKQVFSDKLTAGKIDPKTGKMYRMLHTLVDGKGNKFGIWGTGTLDMIFKRVAPETYIEVTCTGRAEKALKPGQTPPYEFKIKADRDLLDLDDVKHEEAAE